MVTSSNLLNNVPVGESAVDIITFSNHKKNTIYNLSIAKHIANNKDIYWDNSFISSTKCFAGEDIPSNESCVLRIMYTPKSVESGSVLLSAQVSKTSDISKSSIQNFNALTLSYSSIDNTIPEIVISAVPNNLSNVILGYTESAIITVSNVSSEPLTSLSLNDINQQNSAFRWDDSYVASDKCQTNGLSAGAYCTLRLLYQPTSVENGQISLGGVATFMTGESKIIQFTLPDVLFKYSSFTTPNIEVSVDREHPFTNFTQGLYNYVLYTNTADVSVSHIVIDRTIDNPDFTWDHGFYKY